MYKWEKINLLRYTNDNILTFTQRNTEYETYSTFSICCTRLKAGWNNINKCIKGITPWKHKINIQSTQAWMEHLEMKSSKWSLMSQVLLQIYNEWPAMAAQAQVQEREWGSQQREGWCHSFPFLPVWHHWLPSPLHSYNQELSMC